MKAGEIRIIKEAVVTGVPMLIFMAANFVKAFGLNTIIMHMIGEDGMAVFTVCDNVLLLWNKFITSYYESIEETAIASFVTLLENAVVVLPATFIGISIWKQIDGIGTNGIGVAFVATEIITLIAAWIFRKIKHKNSILFRTKIRNQS